MFTLPQRVLCDLAWELREYRANLKPFLKVLLCLLRPLPEAPLGLKVHVREESITRPISITVGPCFMLHSLQLYQLCSHCLGDNVTESPAFQSAWLYIR